MGELPTWEDFMIPTLVVASDGVTRSRRELIALIADVVGLDESQRSVVIPSGQPRYADRISWALSHLSRTGALAKPARGQYRITDAGRAVLAAYPQGVSEKQLDRMARDPVSGILPNPRQVDSTTSTPTEVSTSLDPTEQVEQGIARIHAEVAAELLQRLCAEDPAFFEEVVVQLLKAMGYGGAGGRGVTTSRTNDGGIDGIIDQDVLGLSKVYIQAKRYGPNNAVQRPEVQGFVGALNGKAESGVFITTSRFTTGAKEWADRVPARIILIDGAQLARLMIEYNVGVQVRHSYRIVKIDEDFFS